MTLKTLFGPVASNSSNPLYSGVVTEGHFNKAHLSTAAVVYGKSTIPTPWPILAAGFAVSILSTLWAFTTLFKRPSWFAALGFSIVNGIRSVSALVSVCKAVTFHGGHWIAPSSAGALLLSIIPLMYRAPAPHDALASFETIIAFTAFGVTTLRPFFNKNDLSYGQFQLVGGNCPALFDDYNAACLNTKKYPYPLVGCGWYPTTAYPLNVFSNSTKISTALSTGEKVIGLIVFVPLFLFGIATLIFAGTWLLMTLSLLIAWCKNPTFSKKDETYDEAKKRRSAEAVFLVIKLIILLILTLVTILLHLHQESGPYAIFDSFGPQKNITITSAGSSWSDCFPAYPPTDRLGFLHEWWKYVAPHPELYLSLA